MIQDLRFALRSIRRNKLFAVTALVAFSFGVGATCVVFSVVDAVLLRPATFLQPSTLMSLQTSEERGDWDNVPAWAFDRIRSRTELFSQVTAWRTALFTVTHVPMPDQVFGSSVSGNFFSLLAARPWIGRLLLPEDDRPSARAVALLSYKAWQQLFAGDPAIVGKSAQIDGETFTIVGVMPADFVLPGSQGNGSLWTTLRLTPYELAAPNARMVQVVARLKSSLQPAQAHAALDGLGSSLKGDGDHARTPLRFRASAWHEETDATHRLTIWLLMGMVCALLLIGCANLASILLARSVSRCRENAIQIATGASRAQLVRQCLLELVLLALAALVIADLGASVVLQFIRQHLAAVQTGIPNLARIQLDGRCLLFSFAIAMSAALVCSLFPALSATSMNLSASLRDTGAQISGARPVRRFLYSLVVAEAALSMLLLLTSGLLVHSLVRLLSEDHGLRPEHVLTLRLPTGSWQRPSETETDDTRKSRTNHYLEMLQQAELLKGVQAAALASSLPLSHAEVRTRLLAPQLAKARDAAPIMPTVQAVTRDYFRVMGIPVLAGRSFESRDAASKQQVILVNQAFAREYFRGEDPLGRFLKEPETKDAMQVIGVVKDSPYLDLAGIVEPQVYLNFEQTLLTPFLTGMIIRTRERPEALTSRLRSTLSLQDTTQAVVQVKTVQALIDENIWRPRFCAWLFSAFATIALLLSGIGIYGVIAYISELRRRDFGIHVALGAKPVRVFRLALRQSLAPVIAGAALGALVSYGTSRWISSLLYKTGSFDLTALGVSAAILLVLALAATVGPAFRAARVDPAVTLRAE